jgi:hypothetical protein
MAQLSETVTILTVHASASLQPLTRPPPAAGRSRKAQGKSPLTRLPVCNRRRRGLRHPATAVTLALGAAVAFDVLGMPAPVLAPAAGVPRAPALLGTGLVVAVVGIGPQPLTLPAPAALALAGGVRAVVLPGALRPWLEPLATGQAASRLHRPTLRDSIEARSVGRGRAPGEGPPLAGVGSRPERYSSRSAGGWVNSAEQRRVSSGERQGSRAATTSQRARRNARARAVRPDGGQSTPPPSPSEGPRGGVLWILWILCLEGIPQGAPPTARRGTGAGPGPGAALRVLLAGTMRPSGGAGFGRN